MRLCSLLNNSKNVIRSPKRRLVRSTLQNNLQPLPERLIIQLRQMRAMLEPKKAFARHQLHNSGTNIFPQNGCH